MVKFLFISPHFDDICFSLCHTSSKLRGSRLINIFTRTSYAKPHILTTLSSDIDIAVAVSATRDKEDETFANRYQLMRTNLGLEDAGLYGANPFDLDGLEAEQKVLESTLLSVLRDELSKSTPTVIFCPMAIGEHKNHVAVFNVINDYTYILRSEGATICFYEDLPYASDREKRLNRIEKLKTQFFAKGYERVALKLDKQSIATKFSDIQIYDSQMRRNPPPCINRYSPSIDIDEIHEAFWAKKDEAQSWLPSLLKA